MPEMSTTTTGSLPTTQASWPGGQVGNVTGTEFLLAAVVHDDMQAAGNVILQVSGLAALGVHERFDAGGPFPAGLQASRARR